MKQILVEYDDLFSGKPGNTNIVEMQINTQDHAPIRQPPYLIPLGIRDKVGKEIESLQESSIIERSSSPWASPLVTVRKPDWNVRLCVDYRKLNSITEVEPYYISGINE